MRQWLAVVLFLGLLAGVAPGHALTVTDHALRDDGLYLTTGQGEVVIRFHQPAVVEAHYAIDGLRQLPSFTLVGTAGHVEATLAATELGWRYESEALSVHIQADPLRLSYYRDGEPVVAEESGFFASETLRGFRFSLRDEEKLLGGGQRVLGMDRRGYRLPLYNQASYGYSDHAEQMYFSLPGVVSSRNYMLLFDNSARGVMDLGASEADVLQFQAVAGRTAYIVAAGENHVDTLQQYLAASGMPPLPPRWSLGHFASRFGYRSEAQAREVVRRTREAGLPLDAIVLDLYWFGPDIKGHMGNLAWDLEAWPDPVGMMADFRDQGVQTVLITEPFVLTSSRRWDEAVAANALARNPAGDAQTFDFYFGNTGLIDVFSADAQNWFWSIYRELMQQGVAGWWGDLGEPEVHPDDTVHAAGMAGEIHNAYGHRWAQLLYENQLRDFPSRRPFIMMRAGAPGSQRYGMMPWTGDVERSWAGLQSQVELALQMSVFGFGYTHSDLGGFAGGEHVDAELYTRWLQFGAFQPVFRPHGQEHIAPEPIFHDPRTLSIVRRYLELRYRLMPYHYTLAWQHAREGLPLMRPLFYDTPGPAMLDEANTYLWGNEILVAPVVAPGASRWPVRLPEGVWFDYWSGERFEGPGRVHRPVDLETLPLLVRAGAFIPMVNAFKHSAAYSSETLTLHYYHDRSVSRAEGRMFEDAGHGLPAMQAGTYQILRFSAHADAGQLQLQVHREGDYPGAPAQRTLTLVIHQAPRASSVVIGEHRLTVGERDTERAAMAAWREDNGLLYVRTIWRDSSLSIRLPAQ